MTMLAVRRKPPGEEPEGSRPFAKSLVIHLFLRPTLIQPFQLGNALG
jgi:hypothetical protein